MAAVGLLTVDLHVPDARSLKDRRRVLASIRDRARRRNVSLAEIDHLDRRRHARLGIVAIGAHRDLVDRTLDAVLDEIERHDPGLVLAADREWLT